jgi:hypothetical protein
VRVIERVARGPLLVYEANRGLVKLLMLRRGKRMLLPLLRRSPHYLS